MEKDTLEQIIDYINQSQEILIACGYNFDSDTIAAALSLYLSLSKAGKTVEIVTPQPTTVEFAKFVGINKVTHELSSRKFIITLKDILGSVDKVTHYLEGNQLNIVVHSIPGSEKFSQDKVDFKFAKPSTQLIILVGVASLEDLGKIYIQEQELFTNTPLITITKGKELNKITKLSIGDSRLTFSESVVELINRIRLPIDEDIAGNLFSGISEATENFQANNLTPESLEAAAFCLRAKGQTQLEHSNFDIQLKEISQQEDSITDQIQDQIADDVKTGSNPKDDKPKEDWLTPKIYKSSKPIQ